MSSIVGLGNLESEMKAEHKNEEDHMIAGSYSFLQWTLKTEQDRNAAGPP